jgi:hypothetical protein
MPTSGSDLGKYSCANTNPVTVLYRKKSYHSIVVPIVLAITARLSCLRSSGSEDKVVASSVVTKGHSPSLGTLDSLCATGICAGIHVDIKRNLGLANQPAVVPPSTVMFVPVTQLASSEAK